MKKMFLDFQSKTGNRLLLRWIDFSAKKDMGNQSQNAK